MSIVISIVVLFIILFLIGLLLTAIENYKNYRLKAILDLCNPNTKQTQVAVEASFNSNIGYITKQAKRIMPREGFVEISATSFVLQHKKRDPFLVHDVLHSAAKYLSTLTEASIRIVYDTNFVIRRKLPSGAPISIEREKDQMLALCIHWFIWQYSSNPYKLDQSFEKMPASTNLLLGRMYGYHDVKEYDCSMDCWEIYNPTYGYTKGKKRGIEFTVERSKTRNIYVSPIKHPEKNNFEEINLKMSRDFNEVLILGQEDTDNLFYQIIPNLMKKICFSNDRNMMRNLIAPCGAKSDWGNNFDAWFFAYSVFLTNRILRKKVGDYKLNKYKEEFLSDCETLKVSFADLNLDRYSLEALGGISEFVTEASIGFGAFYVNLESYMKCKLDEFILESQSISRSNEKIQYTAILMLWNYLLFGSYHFISDWNRTTANNAMNVAIKTIVDCSNGYDSSKKTGYDQFDPTLN